jgi:hypothetical protein
MGPVQHTLYAIAFSAMLAAYLGLAYVGVDRAVALFGAIAGVGSVLYGGLKLYRFVKK